MNTLFWAQNRGLKLHKWPRQRQFYSLLDSFSAIAILRNRTRSARKWKARISWEKRFNLNLYGNKVHCTNALLVLIKIMLCGTLHCQFFSRLKLFSYKISKPSVDKMLPRRGREIIFFDIKLCVPHQTCSPASGFTALLAHCQPIFFA